MLYNIKKHYFGKNYIKKLCQGYKALTELNLFVFF
jgi:hypothetical protein